MTDATDNAICMTSASFRWNSDGPDILRIDDLSVAAGERLFVEGPSGSGKTTLLNLLGGISVPQSGTVSLLGTDIARLGKSARDAFRADHIGFIFQMFNLIPYLSLVDNATLPCRFSAARRARSVERSGSVRAEAIRLLSAMRLDVAAMQNRPVTQLSVGQQQRVAAARALIGAPEIVIADEPTSALDGASRQIFLDLLLAEIAAAGSTLVFVSHDNTLLPHFSRAVALPEINRIDSRSEEEV